MRKQETIKMIRKAGQDIFGGCLQSTEYKDGFGTWVVDADFIDVEDIDKVRQIVDLDSIGIERGIFTINFYTK